LTCLRATHRQKGGVAVKPWYKKKKVWVSIIGALVMILTIFLAPKDVETVKVVTAAVLEAAIAIGLVTAEASIDKAAVGNGQKENSNEKN
jgi:VIT1/CCC1 family predicted Fe2+/Mn2+ transporter